MRVRLDGGVFVAMFDLALNQFLVLQVLVMPMLPAKSRMNL
jgi:hypothetical protein